MERIYLDYAATTPLHPKASEAMASWLAEEFGNPSSLYQEGRKARIAIDEAREGISGLLGCEFGELIFTSSGTEAANLAILGCALAHQSVRRKRILMGATEHHAVLHTEGFLQALGFTVERLSVDRYGRISLDGLRAKLQDDVLLVCVMHANNELGSLQPMREVANLSKESGALFLCDAIQTFCVLEWNVNTIGADLIALSAHKAYGPKGVGALYVRGGTKLKPISVGGGQEREMRAGTENVAGIVGFAAAATAFAKEKNEPAMARNHFLDILERNGAVRSVPPEVECLPGHAHVRFPELSAESMLIVLDRLGVSASSGAACSSGSLEPSHVLLASGYSATEAKEGLRFTFGRNATLKQAQDSADRVIEAAKIVRR